MQRSRDVTSILAFGLCALLAARAEAHSDSATTLDELLKDAREHHPSLAKKPLLDQSRDLERSRLSGAYYPQLSLGGQATWQSEVTEVGVAVPGVSISPPPKDQYRVTLDLQQSIWDGGVTADQKEVVDKRTNVEREKANLEWYQVRDNVVGLYFNGVVQQELEAQAKTLDAYLETLIEKTELLVEEGLATERDALLLKARQLEAKQAEIDAAQTLEGVRKGLEELTGHPLLSGEEFAAPPEECSVLSQRRPSPGTVQRPELALLDAQSELTTAQEALSRAGDRPRLGAFATAGYGRPGLNFLNDQFEFYFVGGVQLKVPLSYLYTGTHRTGDRQLAVQRSLISREREAVMTRVNLEYDKVAAEFLRLKAAADLDADLIRVRQGAREQTELQVELGTSSTSDLVDDLTREARAQSREVVHRAQRSLACHRLALIKGER